MALGVFFGRSFEMAEVLIPGASPGDAARFRLARGLLVTASAGVGSLLMSGTEGSDGVGKGERWCCGLFCARRRKVLRTMLQQHSFHHLSGYSL